MDLATVGSIVDRHGAEPGALIQIMLEIQSRANWLPRPALEEVGRRLNVPMARVQHAATFYKAFSMVPKGRHRVNVCLGTACHVRGATRILDSVQEHAGIGPGETDLEHKFSLETVNCLGCCALGPVMELDGKIHGRLDKAGTADVLKRCQ